MKKVTKKDGALYMAEKLWQGIQRECRKDVKAGKYNQIYCIRYFSPSRLKDFEDYRVEDQKLLKAIKVVKSGPQTEQTATTLANLRSQREALRQTGIKNLGNWGENYVNCYNTGNIDPNRRYLFLFPVRSKQEILVRLCRIMHEKETSPEGLACVFSIDPAKENDREEQLVKKIGSFGGTYMTRTGTEQYNELPLPTEYFKIGSFRPSTIVYDVKKLYDFYTSRDMSLEDACKENAELAEFVRQSQTVSFEGGIPDDLDFAKVAAAYSEKGPISVDEVETAISYARSANTPDNYKQFIDYFDMAKEDFSEQFVDLFKDLCQGKLNMTSQDDAQDDAQDDTQEYPYEEENDDQDILDDMSGDDQEPDQFREEGEDFYYEPEEVLNGLVDDVTITEIREQAIEELSASKSKPQ